MATVYRAYHTRTEFEKYRLFTFHITTFLVVMGAASHIRGSGSQLETVRSAQAEVESAHPGATSAAGQAQAVADALARYPPGLAP